MAYRCELKPAKYWRKGILRAAPQIMPVYDRAAIVEKLKAMGGKKILPFNFAPNNQSKWPYCWDFATIQMMQLALNLIDGSTDVLDPSIGPIVTNSINEGNAIDAMWVDVAKVYGVPSAADMGTDPIKGTFITNKSGLPANWKELAAKRMGIESVEAHDPLVLASGILNDHPGALGVDWQGEGHCIGACEVGLVSSLSSGVKAAWHHRQSPPRPRDDDDGLYFATPGTWGAKFANDWGAYPGRPGWYLLHEEDCSAAWSGDTYGAYLVAGIKDEANV